MQSSNKSDHVIDEGITASGHISSLSAETWHSMDEKDSIEYILTTMNKYIKHNNQANKAGVWIKSASQNEWLSDFRQHVNVN